MIIIRYYNYHNHNYCGVPSREGVVRRAPFLNSYTALKTILSLFHMCELVELDGHLPSTTAWKATKKRVTFNNTIQWHWSSSTVRMNPISKTSCCDSDKISDRVPHAHPLDTPHTRNLWIAPPPPPPSGFARDRWIVTPTISACARFGWNWSNAVKRGQTRPGVA